MLFPIIFTNDEVFKTTPRLCSFKVEPCSTSSCHWNAETSPPAVTLSALCRTTTRPVFIRNEWAPVALSRVAAAGVWARQVCSCVASNATRTTASHVCMVQLLLVSLIRSRLHPDVNLFWKPLHLPSCILTIINERVYYLIDGDRQSWCNAWDTELIGRSQWCIVTMSLD